MHVNQTNLHELTRKATDLSSDTEDVARLLRARLGADHEIVRSANDMHASLQSLAYELRCASENHDEIEVSEDT
jgi:ubiquinone biosynthesis protein COQ9